MAFPPAKSDKAPKKGDNEQAESFPDDEMAEGEAPAGGAVCPHCGMPVGGGPGMGAGAGMPPLPQSMSSVPPGQGMDPMEAMMFGLGPEAQAPFPAGPDGLPVGGRQPMPFNELGQSTPPNQGSDILNLLSGMPMTQLGPEMGVGDSQGGAEQLLKMLALARLGAAGNPSGIAPDTNPHAGFAVGM